MAKKGNAGKHNKPTEPAEKGASPEVGDQFQEAYTARHSGPSALLDSRVSYCDDCLEQLQKRPPACVDLIYIDPPFNPNRRERRVQNG